MKQIRKGVFETNSSTQHALVFSMDISSLDIKSIIGSDTIVFGKNPVKYKDRWSPDTKGWGWQEKADYYFETIIGTDYDYDSLSIREFLSIERIIKNIFKSCDIEVEFNLDSVTKDTGIGECEGREVRKLVSEEFSFEKNKRNLLGYLFNEVFLESKCDECCPPEEFEDFVSRYDSFRDSIDEKHLYCDLDRRG